MADNDIKSTTIHNLIFSNTEINLYEYEDELPPLPVPELKQTMQKYLLSVKPFLSEKQFTSTESIVKEFEAGIGQELQSILKEKSKQNKNWMEQWWYTYAYLTTRGSLIPSSNMAGNHPLNLDFWPPVDGNANRYAAISTWIMAEFFKNVRRELLQPHFSFNGEKLSMHQFVCYFNMCRLPGETCDVLKSDFILDRHGNCPNHVIVFCNGHIWQLDPWDAKGEQLQVGEIEQQIEYIKSQSWAMPRGPEIAAFTLSSRPMWAANRSTLQSLSQRNSLNLSLIESAVFHLVLEEMRPANIEEAYSDALCGFSGNRWADKANSTIVYDNGYVAANSERSPVDAMVSVLIGYYAIELVRNEFKDVWREEPPNSKYIRLPKMLQFDLDDTLTASISTIKKENFQLQTQIDARFFMFASFGKNWMKPMKLHADTFTQCAIQLAYYTMHKKLAPTYETATTRKFFRGRTETVRSCTLEMVEWLKSMTSLTAGVGEKKAKLLTAMKIHLRNMRECQNGQGIDRHLMGLNVAALENGFGTPHLFTDPAYIMSGSTGNFVLSTSTVGSGHGVGGVTPMVMNGYAVMYCFLPERIHFTVTCYRNNGTCSSGFISSLESSLIQLKDLLGMPLSNL